MNVELNIFTNTHESSPGIRIVKNTYDSFVCTFGELPTTIYCDIHPNIDRSKEYIKNLEKVFDRVIVTTSLSDGYLKSIENSKADYLFQLENDWIFNDNIEHTLNEITDIMDALKIYHFRFNKRSNVISGWDSLMVESQYMDFKFCSCNNLSNNPHIISRKRYDNDIKNYIQNKPGSKGIEECLNKYGLATVIYGGFGHSATIFHLDGKHS
jgi:hypothetical protein